MILVMAGVYLKRKSSVLGEGGRLLIQLGFVRSGFSFDISFCPAKIGSADKAKPCVRLVRKATDI